LISWFVSLDPAHRTGLPRNTPVKEASQSSKKSGNKNKDYKLKSYNVENNGDEVQDMNLRVFLAGVMPGIKKRLYPGSPSASKTSVSQL